MKPCVLVCFIVAIQRHKRLHQYLDEVPNGVPKGPHYGELSTPHIPVYQARRGPRWGPRWGPKWGAKWGSVLYTRARVYTGTSIYIPWGFQNGVSGFRHFIQILQTSEWGQIGVPFGALLDTLHPIMCP